MTKIQPPSPLLRGWYKNIIVCGSVAYDRIMDFPGKFSDHILPGKTHILNVAFAVNGIKESFGGTGGNIAYNLALLGERPKLISVGGADFGKYQIWLKKNKIDLRYLKVIKDKPTACAYIMTDQADNQISGFYGGAKIQPSLPALSRDMDALAIVAPDNIARMLEYVKIFKQRKIPYIFDPGQGTTALTAGQLKWAAKGAKVLIGNDYEIQLIADKTGLSLKQLEKAAEIVIITKGAKGSAIYHQGKKIIVPPAKPKNTSDPTGAGDAYRAGFIKGLAMHLPLAKCGRLAATVAVYTVEKYGTQTHRFSWRELDKRYRENYHEKL